VCLTLAAFPHYCTDPDVTWRNDKECRLVVHYWVDLQSVHGFHCYDSIAPNAKYQRVLVCLVYLWQSTAEIASDGIGIVEDLT